jgi:hypothetical protein
MIVFRASVLWVNVFEATSSCGIRSYKRVSLGDE